MHLKRFRGPHLPDVLRQIREELGPEAVILHTRHPERGLRRLFTPRGVEVLAAVDRVLPPSSRAIAGDDGDRAVLVASAATRGGVPGGLDVRGGSAPDLRAELEELRRLLIRLGGAGIVEHEVQALYERLVATGVEPPLAFKLVSALPPDRARGQGANLQADRTASAGRDDCAGFSHATQDALQAVLDDLIRIDSPPLGHRDAVVAAVGPAGAGKTTIIAKLAAHAHLAGTTVQLISVDDGGLGAPSPLETFGAIIGAPHTMAQTTAEVARAVVGGARRGLVLVDSPGLAPRETGAITDLNGLLNAAGATEIHLVLPATTRSADAVAAARAFTRLGATHLLFTRLDETSHYGGVISVSAAAGLPLSYFSTGRDVPSDIERATIRALVRRVLHGEP